MIAKDSRSTIDVIASALAAGDPMGSSADEIAAALGLPIDGTVLQNELEAMVDQGILDRHGIGRGALYALARQAMGISALNLKQPTVRKVG